NFSAALQMNERDKRRMGIAGIALILASVALGVGTFFGSKAAPTVPAKAAVTPDVHTFDHVTLSAKAATVYDLTTGQTLFGKNADTQLPLASLTKLLTMYAALDSLSAESPVTISKTALAQDGDNGFTEGQTFQFESLARFALAASSNDAAEAIEEAAGN